MNTTINTTNFSKASFWLGGPSARKYRTKNFHCLKILAPSASEMASWKFLIIMSYIHSKNATWLLKQLSLEFDPNGKVLHSTSRRWIHASLFHVLPLKLYISWIVNISLGFFVLPKIVLYFLYHRFRTQSERRVLNFCWWWLV